MRLSSKRLEMLTRHVRDCVKKNTLGNESNISTNAAMGRSGKLVLSTKFTIVSLCSTGKRKHCF